ncbi:MAG: type II toxin-antitoxin system Phd/YefM family antitoxin [Candidatus Omnitrophica bacterium]|nr:type II toxin-antitoxin system Phd/YefM family antitoxin [Candidatus Omnitrophota bacterium]
MDHIVPLSEARSNLSTLIKKLATMSKHLVITRNGRAAAVMMTPEELETLEIMADKILLRSVIRAKEDVKRGKLFKHEDVFRNV